MSDLLACNATTVLAAAIVSTVATTITVSNNWGFPPSGNFYITVDAEFMQVTGISGTTWTVVRGQYGSTATTHPNGAPVTGVLSLYASMFGAMGDGYTDDTAALQNAITATEIFGGMLVLTPQATYKTTSVLKINVPMSIQGNGATIQNIGGTYPDNTGIFIGSILDTPTSFGNASISAGTNTISMSSGLSVGAVCLLSLGTDPYDSAIPHWQEIVTILSNSGSNITINKVIPYTTNVGALSNILTQILGLAENISIDNLVVDTATNLGSYNAAAAIQVTVARNIRFTNIRLFGTQFGIQPAENIYMDNVYGFITANLDDQRHGIRCAKVNGFYGTNLHFDMNEKNEAVFFESQCQNLHIGSMEINALNTSATPFIAMRADCQLFIDHLRINNVAASGIYVPYLSDEGQNGFVFINTLEYNGPFFAGASAIPRVDRLIYNGNDLGVYQRSRVTFPVTNNTWIQLSLACCTRRVFAQVNQVPSPADWTIYYGYIAGADGFFVDGVTNGITLPNKWVEGTGMERWGSGYGNDFNSPERADTRQGMVIAQGNGTIPGGTTITLDIEYWPLSTEGRI